MSQPEVPSAAGAAVPQGDPPLASRSSLAVAAAGSTIWSLASQVLQTLLGFGTTMLLTRWLRPEDYGIFAMASTVVAFVGILGDGGLATALVRRRVLEPAAESTAFVMTMVGGLGFAVLALLAAPALGLYFKSRDVGVMAAALSTNFLILAPGRVSFALLSRNLRFRAISVIGITTSVASSGCSLLAASRGFHGWSLAIGFLSAPLAVTGLYLMTAPPKVDLSLFSRGLARELSAFGANLSGFTVAVCVAWLPWTMLLGRVVDPAAVGLFGMGTRLVVLSTDKIGGAFSAVFLPSISKMIEGDRQRAYLATLRTLAMCTAPVAIGFIAVADELVTILPSRWDGLAAVMKGLALGAMVGPWATLATTLLTAEGRSSTVLRLGLFTIPVVWLAAGLAAYSGRLSAFVTAWSSLTLFNVAVFLSVPAGSWRGLFQIGRSVSRPTLTAALMGVVIEAIQRFTGTAGHRLGLPLGIATGIVAYLGLARLFMKDDLMRTLRLLSSAVRGLHRR